MNFISFPPRGHISFTGTHSTCRISLCETELDSPSSQEMVTSLQDNGAKIGERDAPTNTVAYLESSGLIAGHSVRCPQTPHAELDLSVR